jgi:hypothetical protein
MQANQLCRTEPISSWGRILLSRQVRRHGAPTGHGSACAYRSRTEYAAATHGTSLALWRPDPAVPPLGTYPIGDRCDQQRS